MLATVAAVLIDAAQLGDQPYAAAAIESEDAVVSFAESPGCPGQIHLGECILAEILISLVIQLLLISKIFNIVHFLLEVCHFSRLATIIISVILLVVIISLILISPTWHYFNRGLLAVVLPALL